MCYDCGYCIRFDVAEENATIVVAGVDAARVFVVVIHVGGVVEVTIVFLIVAVVAGCCSRCG